MLTALRNFPSEFKVQDIEGKTHPAEDLGYADDLQSIEATHKALQDKADMVCVVYIHGYPDLTYQDENLWRTLKGPQREQS